MYPSAATTGSSKSSSDKGQVKPSSSGLFNSMLVVRAKGTAASSASSGADTGFVRDFEHLAMAGATMGLVVMGLAAMELAAMAGNLLEISYFLLQISNVTWAS